LQVTIRTYQAPDRDSLYDICLRTGASGEDATDLYTDPRLLGEIYVGPYLEFEPDLAFVVTDSEGVAGYVLGATDTAAFEAKCEDEWWPPLRSRYPLGAFADGTTDARLVRLIHEPHLTPDHITDDYPAHLHIDLLPRAQGHGYGRLLLETLFDALAHRGVRGLHLGVGVKNVRAFGFYERIGFHTLSRSDVGRMMGIGLA
jgi:ribosomal protein S18 acetylase RimI-like enzyme